MRVCPHCQLPTVEAGSFCPSCGKPLQVQEAARPLMGTIRFPPAAPTRPPGMHGPAGGASAGAPSLPQLAQPGSAPHAASPGSAPGGAAPPPGSPALHDLPSASLPPSAPLPSGPAAPGLPSAAALRSPAPSVSPFGATAPHQALGPGAEQRPPGPWQSPSPRIEPARGAAGSLGDSSQGELPQSAPSHGPLHGAAASQAAAARATGPARGSAARAATPDIVSLSAMTADSIPIPDPRHALLGAVIDGFAIDAILGSGGCGTVYRGRQLGLDRPVAIKVPTFDVVDDPVLKKRFLREARAAARVRHPSVVTIYGVGEVPDGRPYLAMELLEGVSLMEVLDDGPLELDRALALARQIALALAETHAAGVVHRDLKPSNIIWRRDRSGADRITIVDFGIAAGQQGSADATRLTAGGKVIGTPHYMAPEQAQGEHQDIDHRTDLYALGCLLFELLTNEVPFDGTGFEVVLAHMAKQPEPPSKRLARIPREVDELVMQLMRKRPEDRPASAEVVVARIDELRATLAARGEADRTEPAMATAAAGDGDEPTVIEVQSSDARWGADSGAGGAAAGGGGARRREVDDGAASTMLASAGVPPGAAVSLSRAAPYGEGAPVTSSRSSTHQGPPPPGSHSELRPGPGSAAQHSIPGSGPHRSPHAPSSSPPGTPQHSLAGSPQHSLPSAGSGPHGSPQHSRPSAAAHRPRTGPYEAPRRPTHALSSTAMAQRRQRRWRFAMVAAAVCAVAALAGLSLQRVLGGGEASPAPAPGSVETPIPTPPTPPTPTPDPQRPPPMGKPGELQTVMLDSGQLSMRMVAPPIIAANKKLRVPMELWDDGEPLTVPSLQITVEKPDGSARGFSSLATPGKPGIYELRLELTEPGSHVVRVFPEGTDTDATFEVPFYVVVERR